MLGATGSKYRPKVSVTPVGHPRLAGLVRRAATRPVVTITAGPGWGKTTFAAQWATVTGASWCNLDAADRDPNHLGTSLLAAHPGSPEAVLDGDDIEVLAEQVIASWSAAGPARVVLDDADVLVGSRALELLERVCSAVRPTSQLVVVSRHDLRLIGARDRASGAVLEVDATHLALGTDRVDRLLADELAADRPLAARIADATGGWPAAVRLAVEALHEVPEDERSACVRAATAPDGPVGAYVRSVLLAELPATTERLLTQLALVGPCDADRIARVLRAPAVTIDEVSRSLTAVGLLQHEPDEHRAGWLVVAPALRRVLIDRQLPERPDRDAVIDEVVDALVAEGEVGHGLLVLTRTGQVEAAAELLERHGDDLIRRGELATVTRAVAAVPDALRTPRIERVHGLALAYRGEWAAALRCLDLPDTSDDGPLSTELALNLGMIHHLRGDLDTALATYTRGPDADRDDPAHAALLAWRSTAHWLRGEVEDAHWCAEAAMREATATGDDRASALAHTAAAMVAASGGDRRANEVHYDLALAAARRADDRLQLARILTNRGSRHLENGEYEEALRETDEAIDLAEGQGFAMILGVARCNRAEIHLHTGRLDEAIADAESARDTFARIGSRLESYAHHLLGDARREQGDLVLAKLAYERALRLAEPAGDRQGQVPAYTGLARTLAGIDPDAAEEAAARALALDDGMATVSAHLAAAWIALARGDASEAGRIATEASVIAEQREDRAGTAEATTLLAMLDHDPVPGLRRAARLWWEVDARISATRAELGVARRDPASDARAGAQALERRLLDWGCSPDGGAFAHRVVAGSAVRSRPVIRVLGTFAVERGGRPVPRAEWGSKKARELLKVLVVRGGRSIAREELADLLWPGEAYETVSNRLSVALSVVRGVLAGDARAEVTALRADDRSVALDPEAVEVDLTLFRRLAEDGLRRARTPDRAGALDLLLAAEEAYRGDLLEDDRDVTWLVDRREELRTLYVSVARVSADLVADEDPDRAMRLLLRVLDRDGYDEPAHLGVCRALLRSGRHGEARRRHRLYATRMAELDLPAVPFHELQERQGGGQDRPRAEVG